MHNSVFSNRYEECFAKALWEDFTKPIYRNSVKYPKLHRKIMFEPPTSHGSGKDVKDQFPKKNLGIERNVQICTENICFVSFHPYGVYLLGIE